MFCGSQPFKEQVVSTGMYEDPEFSQPLWTGVSGEVKDLISSLLKVVGKESSWGRFLIQPGTDLQTPGGKSSHGTACISTQQCINLF